MEWILAVTLFSGEVLANNFKTEAECVSQMHQTIKAMEAEGEKFTDVSCTKGIVISAIDEDED